MLPEAPVKDRELAPDDPALHPVWPLLEFLASIGADEFTVSLVYLGDDGVADCDELARGLAFASVGERTRECTATRAGDGNPRPVPTWRLDPPALAALRGAMPDGIFEVSGSRRAWAEDLCVYRGGELLFGTVTHECFAFLRLSDAEWDGWRSWAAGPR